MHFSRPSLTTLKIIKEAVVYLGIPLLLAMAIHANSTAARQATATGALVNSQTQILYAIKEVTTDNKTDNVQKTNLIICMLQVPVSERTTDLLQSCRKQTDGTSTPEVITPNSALPKATTPAPSTPVQPHSSSSAAPRPSSPSQPSTSPIQKPSVLKQITNFLGL